MCVEELEKAAPAPKKNVLLLVIENKAIISTFTKVFNLEIEDNEKYYVTEEGILVHNGYGAGKNNFKSESHLDKHFEEHGYQIKDVLDKPTYTKVDYLNDANYVIENPEMNGYVQFAKGTDYAFVGLDRVTGEITTFHIKNIKELIKNAPSLGFGL